MTIDNFVSSFGPDLGFRPDTNNPANEMPDPDIRSDVAGYP